MSNERIECERVPDALDDYLAAHLPAATHAAFDTHVAECPECRALVADVRAIRAVARTLGPIEPPEHVWRKLRARVDVETPPRTSLLDRLGLTAFQPLAAAAVLALVVSGLSWVGVRLADTPPVPSNAGAAVALPEFELAEAEYTDAIARLEEAADAARPRLDALTSETLRSSIDDIDIAIGDARDALAREPGDALSQESLLDALGSKVALLQDTMAMLGNLEPATEEQIQ
ncbi:MAG TPA: zf-HC2 domain-containing protein [Methylomirabilota bacterium]|nr:zf-HC2 domain-containing protein [Methylomirabilota bacterium]